MGGAALTSIDRDGAAGARGRARHPGRAAGPSPGGAVALVAGEAGAGKSALVTAFAAKAAGRRPGCSGAVAIRCSPRVRSARCTTSARQVGGVLAERLTALHAGAAPEAEGRGAVFDALLDELTDPRHGRRTVMVVEDAHWADGATLDLIAYLGRRLTRCRGPARAHPTATTRWVRTTRCTPCSPGCPGRWCAGCRCRRCPRPPSPRWPAAPAAPRTGCTRPPVATRCWSPRCWPRPGRECRRPYGTWCWPGWPRCRRQPGRSPPWSRWCPSRAESYLLDDKPPAAVRGVPGPGRAGAGGQRGGVPARAAAAGRCASPSPRCAAPPCTPPCWPGSLGRSGRGRRPAGAPRAPRRRRGGRAALGAGGGPPGRDGGRAPAGRRPLRESRCRTPRGCRRRVGPSCWRRTRPPPTSPGWARRRSTPGGRRWPCGRPTAIHADRREPALGVSAVLVDRGQHGRPGDRHPGGPGAGVRTARRRSSPWRTATCRSCSCSPTTTSGPIDWGGRALELARRLGDLETEAHALVNVGSARLQSGDLAGVVELERAHALAAAASPRRPRRPGPGQPGHHVGGVVRPDRAGGRALDRALRVHHRPGSRRVRPAPARLPGPVAAGHRRLGRRPRRRRAGADRHRAARRQPGAGAWSR